MNSSSRRRRRKKFKLFYLRSWTIESTIKKMIEKKLSSIVKIGRFFLGLYTIVFLMFEKKKKKKEKREDSWSEDNSTFVQKRFKVFPPIWNIFFPNEKEIESQSIRKWRKRWARAENWRLTSICMVRMTLWSNRLSINRSCLYLANICTEMMIWKQCVGSISL